MGIPLFIAWSIVHRTDVFNAPRVHRRPQWQRVAEFQNRAPETGHRGEARELVKKPARLAQAGGKPGKSEFQPVLVHARELEHLTLPVRALLRRSFARTSQALPLCLLLTPSALSTLNLCPARSTMASMLFMIPEGLRLAFGARHSLVLENLALRHQIAVPSAVLSGREADGRRRACTDHPHLATVEVDTKLVIGPGWTFREGQPPDHGKIIEIPLVGGLHHRYTRQAA